MTAGMTSWNLTMDKMSLSGQSSWNYSDNDLNTQFQTGYPYIGVP